MQQISTNSVEQLPSQTQSQQFAQLLNDMPVVAFAVNHQSHISYINTTAAAILQAEKMPPIELGCPLDSASIIPCATLTVLIKSVIADGIERSADIELVLPVHKLALCVQIRAHNDNSDNLREVIVIGREQAGVDPAIASVSSAVKSWQSLFSNLEFYVWTYYFATDTVALTPRSHQDLDLPEDSNRRIPFERYLQLIHPQDRSLARERYRSFLNKPQAPRLKQEYRLRHSDGHYIWIQDKLSLQFDADKQSQYGVGVFQDISAELANKDAMIKNANRLELALELINGALWDYDAEQGEFIIDDRHKVLLGALPEGYFDTALWAQRIHRDDRKRVLNAFATLTKDNSQLAFQYRMKMHNDDYFHAMSICLATHFAVDGTLLKATGVLYDYSAIALAQKQLVASEERLNLALEVAHEGVWEYFPHDNRAFRSKGYLKLLGYNTGPDKGGPLWHDVVHPEDLPMYDNRMSQLEEGIRDEDNLEVRVIHQRGHSIDVEFRCRVVARSPDGRAQRIIGIAEDVSTRVAQRKEIAALAYYDPLTGLPNRRLVLERANQALELEARHHNPVTLMILDLDKFKEINDTLGHAAGDKVLVELAARFQTCMRFSDTLGRQGGDEFIVVLPACDEDQAYRVAKRIIEKVALPIIIQGREISCGVSIGIAKARENGETIDELLRNADIAMYRAKDSHSNIAWFDAAYAKEMEHRIKLEQDLRVAIRESHLAVVYQPRVSLDTGVIISVEALMRWQHPELGVVAPADFIPIAEESGLIVDLGRSLIDSVCRQQLHWRRLGIDTTVSINVSPGELISEYYAQHLLDTMNGFGLPVSSIEVELTETAAIANWKRVISTLDTLDSAGIVISLDDWGTGHSSLSYLTQIPAHYVKLDRTFIENLDHSDPKKNTQLILRGMTALTQSLGFELVAEGIETIEQAQAVKQLGCIQGQGYLFSAPLNPDKITALLHQLRIALPF